MSKSVIFFLAIVAAVSSQITPVLKCKGAADNLFESVVVTTPSGVCTKLPCNLVSGKDVVTEIKFSTKWEVEKITMKCNATSLGITIDYPLPDATNGCDYLTNTFCPVEADTTAEYTFTMNVNKLFPLVPVDLVIYLLDQSNKMISCFEVPTKVVAK